MNHPWFKEHIHAGVTVPSFDFRALEERSLDVLYDCFSRVLVNESYNEEVQKKWRAFKTLRLKSTEKALTAEEL